MISFLLFTVVPYAFIAWVLKEVCMGVYAKFIRPVKDFKTAGEWALVTGCTDGIGEAYVFELARRGLNIVLISRTQAKLDKTAADIQSHTGMDTMTIACDCSQLTPEKLAEIENKLKPLKELGIAVWVNNVGVSYDYPEYFDKLGAAARSNMTAMNVHCSTEMTHMAIRLKARYIVNISSFASVFACPLLSQYSASKAYIDMLSTSLNAELQARKIHVQTQNPLHVVSKLSKIRRSSLAVPAPKTFVQASVRAIGYEAQSCPYWHHATTMWVLKLCPVWLQNKIILNQHSQIRQRKLAKLKRQGQEQGKQTGKESKKAQ